MKYFSMFSGIGGFELGIKYAYEQLVEITTDTSSQRNIKKSKSRRRFRQLPTCIGYSDSKIRHVQQSIRRPNNSGKPESRRRHTEFDCVGYSEIDKYAIQIYEKQFPGHKNYGDATKIDTAELPDFDLLIGGVPCQAWSIAGKRKGFEDSRGTMWFECFRIIKDKKPRFILLENVKGLLSHNGGNSFERICECICELGYAIDFEVLNSKDFGVPQNRERVFIVGIRLDLLNKAQIF